MQLNRMAGVLAAMTMLAGGGAIAAPQDGFRGEATLAAPGAQARTAVVNGVTWSCEGDRCTGLAERFSSLDSHMKECRKVAAAIGPMTSYRSRGLQMSKGSLGVCNRAATEMGTQAPN